MFVHARRRAWRRPALSPRFEPLEGRELLSAFTGPSAIRAVQTTGGIFQIQVSGPGSVQSALGGPIGHYTHCVWHDQRHDNQREPD